MSEATRQVYVGFVGDKCIGAFVSEKAALYQTRTAAYALHAPATGGLFWSSWQDDRCTLHVSDECTHTEYVARVEVVTLERRSPFNRRAARGIS